MEKNHGKGSGLKIAVHKEGGKRGGNEGSNHLPIEPKRKGAPPGNAVRKKNSTEF